MQLLALNIPRLFLDGGKPAFTFCGRSQWATPSAGWWAAPAGSGSSGTGSAAPVPRAARRRPAAWTRPAAARPPCCPEPPPVWPVAATTVQEWNHFKQGCSSRRVSGTAIKDWVRQSDWQWKEKSQSSYQISADSILNDFIALRLWAQSFETVTHFLLTKQCNVVSNHKTHEVKTKT